MDIRESILSADDLKTEIVHVPEWDTTVYVRSMTAVERDEYENDLIKNQDGDNRLLYARTKLAILCSVDEEGERIFAWEDVQALAKKSARAVGRIADAAQILNAMTEQEIESISGN